MNEEDPEVRADLELRDRTERERKPSEMVRLFQEDQTPIGKWKCRSCFQFVDVTAGDFERKAMWDRILADRGERPLERDKIMVCTSCQKRLRETEGDRNRDASRRLSELVRRFRESPAPKMEHELLRDLRLHGHPDVDGLYRVVVERWEKENNRPRSGPGL